jgi:tetratricopeptide (TPR) repeat protein
MWHYVRGLAMAARGRFDEAAAEQKRLDAIAAAMPPDREIGDNNRGQAVLKVASATLRGQSLSCRSDRQAAVRALTEAVALQDALAYEEPPIWYFPVREALGNELLIVEQPTAAEAVYREDLRRNPANPRSLYGLARALRAQGKTADAAAADREWRRQWRYAEVPIDGK